MINDKKDKSAISQVQRNWGGLPDPRSGRVESGAGVLRLRVLFQPFFLGSDWGGFRNFCPFIS